MTQYALVVDYERCIGCHACEVACKQENNLPVGPRWIRVIQLGPRKEAGKLSLGFKVTRCMHCEIPSCVAACPKKAITKRADGIVLINPELCNGCKNCIEACSFGAPQIDSEKMVVSMCNLCVQRVERGLIPSCAQNCLANAIYFGDIDKSLELLRKKRAEMEAIENSNKTKLHFH